MIMGIDSGRLINDALASGAERAAMTNVSKIRFHEEFRKACERNACGKYNTNWMGPPAVGEISELMKRVRKYKHGLIFQTMHSLSGSFDLKGMLEGGEKHRTVLMAILKRLKTSYGFDDILPLSAGCCSYCPKCAYLDGESCRHPEEAMASIEAYGIDAVRLTKDSGLPYHSGKNTVSYVGLILFNPADDSPAEH